MSRALGGGGIAVGIKDNRPTELKTQNQREAEAKSNHQNAVQKSASLLHELVSTPTLEVIMGLMEARLNELAKNDEQFMSYVHIVTALRYEIETMPVMTEKVLHRVMGPVLVKAMREEQMKRELRRPLEDSGE